MAHYLLLTVGFLGILPCTLSQTSHYTASSADKPTPVDPSLETPSFVEINSSRHSSGNTSDSSNRRRPRCRIFPMVDDFAEYIQKVETETRVVLFEFTLHMYNYTKDPLYSDISHNYKPYRWFRTRSRHGRTLLMLSFNYDVLSMTILKIGVQKMDLNITDRPFGCFRGLSPEQRMQKIRNILVGKFDAAHDPRYGSDRRNYACNQIIKNVDGYADFVYNCCHRARTGEFQCTDESDDLWISILYISVSIVKVLVFCFSPYLLPANMYSAMYVAGEYLVKLKKEIKLSIFITEQPDVHVKYKKRLTLEDIADWRRFREAIDNMPQDEIIPLKMNELRITVKGKRIIPQNEPPTGLMRTLYDNLCRCKIKALSPFDDCCDRSVFASMEPKFKHQVTWHSCVQILVKLILLLLLPFPYYIRLYVYYKFEHQEMQMRHEAIDSLGMQRKYHFYKNNVIQYYSPTHAVFIATYCFYFLAGVVLGFSGESVRDKIKQVTRCSLQDMANVSQVGVLQVILRVGLWPFKKCGLLAILLAPIYIVITSPFSMFLLAVYCIPTIYLSFRLLFHSRRQIGSGYMIEEVERRKKFKKIQVIGQKLSVMDKTVHGHEVPSDDESCFPTSLGFRGCYAFRMLMLQVVCGAFCLSILYSVALVVAESFGLMIEVMAFTMMGIIVNASATLKYVSMVLLVFVYMHDCYNNVYNTYLDFNKSVIDDMIDRSEDLKKVASLPSSMQENAAFQVKTVDEVPPIKTQLNFTKREISWKVGHLLLFLDSFDTPRIPLRYFKRLCEVQVYGAPGPVYLNLLRATGKFLVIVIFLLFVMIVVMAFGSVTRMSSTNQTLATMAGGFVPMLLKNVLSSKSVKLSLKTISFKGQIDEIICEFKQNWPVKDLVVERDIPEPEDQKEEGDEKENDKDEGEKGEKGKKGEKDKKANAEKGPDSSDISKSKKEKLPNGESSLEKSDKDKGGGKGKDSDNKDEKKQDESPPIRAMPSKPGDDENTVDIFIDLSAADSAASWSIYGSNDSLPSTSMMPAYFDPNKVITTYPAGNPV
ncbi:uncharacterized protein LOC121376057 [Gigantopelta aegis]|uniref:uncharacterized protein LOC121376057 n=1 Tax=Gigantopelta aegis TaxID=1735272 RepID=UPI001B887864|nr:uncharacterized protein LOC121376057 [Gigantopelta aegis]XP_041359768.1 uncharacterized protein LOC121376057 [Gigantopelta aegis]